MQITPINRTNFKGYGYSDMQKLTKYALERQKGSMYDLNKKFAPDLIKTFTDSGRLHVDRALQSWQADKFLREMPPMRKTKNFGHNFQNNKKAFFKK